MTIKETAIIERLSLFFNSNKEEFVIENDISEFKSLIRSIIYSNQTISNTDLFFHKSTIQSQIKFKDYVKLEKPVLLIKEIYVVLENIINDSMHFLEKIDSLISKGTHMDETLKTNHSIDLKERLLNETIELEQFEEEHIYLSSRLTDELKEMLIHENSIFRDNKTEHYSYIGKLLD